MGDVNLKLLISIKSFEEAVKIKDCNFDILDIKNPREGSLGANYPAVIKNIAENIDGYPISAAGGDLDNKIGTASLITFGLAHTDVDYIKLGLCGVREKEEAKKLLEEAVKALKLSGKKSRLIAAAYADFREENTLSPFILNELAFETEIDGIMIDTLNKEDKNLFDFLSAEELKSFVSKAEKAGVLSALAGSLRINHLDELTTIDPDIIGFRGAVCTGNDRGAEISAEKINNLYAKIRSVSSNI